MRAYNLEKFITQTSSWGIADVLMPFILLFTIFYGVMAKSEVLSKKKGINAGFAAVVALIPITIHVTGYFPNNYDPIDIINQAIPGVAMVAVMMIFFLIFLGVFGGKTSNFNYESIGLWSAGGIAFFVVNTIWHNTEYFAFTISLFILIAAVFLSFKVGFPSLYDVVISASIITVLYFFGRTVGWFNNTPAWISNSYYVGVAVSVVFIVIIIGFAMDESSDKAN